MCSFVKCLFKPSACFLLCCLSYYGVVIVIYMSEPFVRHTYCEYFLPVYDLPFHFLKSVF